MPLGVKGGFTAEGAENAEEGKEEQKKGSGTEKTHRRLEANEGDSPARSPMHSLAHPLAPVPLLIFSCLRPVFLCGLCALCGEPCLWFLPYATLSWQKASPS